MKNKTFLLALCLFVFSVSLLILTIFNSSEDGSYSYSYNFTLSYPDLNQEERSYVNAVFSQINPLYLTGHKEILIVRNMSEYCDDCAGVNYGHGKKIVVLFRTDKSFKRTICHELFHTWFKRDFPDEKEIHPEHQIIYDLADKGVCYE